MNTRPPPVMQRRKCVSDFDTRISGIPCGILVGKVDITKGTHSSNASCPEEFYGGSEIEFQVLDSRGYSAPWLEKKLTHADVAQIESAIIDMSEAA